MGNGRERFAPTLSARAKAGYTVLFVGLIGLVSWFLSVETNMNVRLVMELPWSWEVLEYRWADLRRLLYWVLCALLAYRFYAWMPLSRGRYAIGVPVHLAISLLVPLLYVLLNIFYWRYIMQLGLEKTTFTAFLELLPWHIQDFLPYLYGRDLMGMLAYWIGLTAILGVRSHEHHREEEMRRAQLENQFERLRSELTRAELETLRTQLRPHFFFNSLNTALSFVREKRNEDAVQTLADIGDLLRRTFRRDQTPYIPLREEFHFLELYLRIEKARFGERLDYCLELPTALEELSVPNMVLQPLVENAVRHGVSQRIEGGRLRVSAHPLAEGGVRLCVANDGPPLEETADLYAKGVGMSNTRARLRTIYGDDFALTHGNVDGWVRFCVDLPERPLHPQERDASDETTVSGHRG